MSTVFCEKFVLYLIQSKHFSSFQDLRKGVKKPLTGLRVSKAGRPDLYRRSPYGQILKHVFDRLDASQAHNWYLDGPPRFPYQSQSDGFDGRAGQPARWAPQA